jgi:5-methylcytosine-specific restriction protein A
MGKLKAIQPRLKPIGSRLKPAMTREESEQQRYRERDKVHVWRKWYYTARWKKLRQEILVRDSYTCQQTGVLCIGKYPADNSPVVDHVKQHHGDEQLFWDATNLQTVSKGYHDKVKQSLERGSFGGLGQLISDNPMFPKANP